MAPGVTACNSICSEACSSTTWADLPWTVVESSSHEINLAHSIAFEKLFKPSPAFDQMVRSYRPQISSNISPPIGLGLGGEGGGTHPWPLIVAGVIVAGVTAGAAYLYNYEKNRRGNFSFSGLMTTVATQVFGKTTMEAGPAQPNPNKDIDKLLDPTRDKPEEKLATPDNVPSWETLVPEEETMLKESNPELINNPCIAKLIAEHPDFWNRYVTLSALARIYGAQMNLINGMGLLTELFRLIVHSRDGTTGPLNDVIGKKSALDTFLSMCGRPNADVDRFAGKLEGILGKMDSGTLQRAYEMLILRQQIIDFIGTKIELSTLDRATVESMVRPFVGDHPALLQFLQ